MGPRRPRADAGDHLNLRRLPRPPVALWAGLTGLPFAVVAVGALASRGPVVPTADFALIDMAARRAQRWHQLLGVFDRFGWHHPGPAYLYVVSFLLRVAGPAHGAQAQVAAAAVVAGAAAVGTVAVSSRLWPGEGRERAAAGAAGAAVVSASVAVVGRALMANPWNPYVVVLPTLLTIVLAVAAARGSASALAAAVLVGSFTVQTDIGTAPAIGVALVGATAGFAWTRVRGTAPGTTRPSPSRSAWAGPIALGLLAAVVWVPVLVEQATAHPGNLTLLWRFFTSSHAHAGLSVGATVTGAEQASLVGITPPALVLDPHPGWVAFAVSLALTVAAVALCWWRREAPAAALAGAGGLATVAGLVAGAQIVGPAYGYLLAWTVAAGIAVVLAVGLAVGSRLWPAAAVCAVVAAAGLLARAVPLAGPAALADPRAAAAWRLVAPVAAASPGTRIGLAATDAESLFALAGVADELDLRGMAFSVPPEVAFSFGPGHRALPGRWLVVVRRGSPVPAGYRSVGTAGDVTVGVADTRPPGWS